MAAGIISAVAFGAFAPAINVWLTAENIRIDNAYVAIGGVFAIIAGFLASFYGSIQSIADTRLKRISQTGFFKLFISQIKEATIAGFIISVISVPLMIVAPTNINSSIYTRLIIAVWLGASTYCFAAFIRVGPKLFVVFEKQPAPDRGAG